MSSKHASPASLVAGDEGCTGIRVVKSHAREEYEEKKFRDSSAKMNKLIMRYGRATELVGGLLQGEVPILRPKSTSLRQNRGTPCV